MFPILWDHQHDKVVGHLEMIGDTLHFKFTDDVQVERQALFDLFGNAGIMITEMEKIGDAVIVKAGKILEFSIVP